MMERADFYVGMGESADWIGSISKGGSIWEIPTDIIIQVNRVMFEEMCIEYIKSKQGVVANHICQWPWDWEDSRLTSFAYIFSPEHEKVYVSIEGNDLMDPLKIVQGYSIIEANVMLGPPIFPVMIETISIEEAENGSEITSII
jgi:hypothetical protein